MTRPRIALIVVAGLLAGTAWIALAQESGMFNFKSPAAKQAVERFQADFTTMDAKYQAQFDKLNQVYGKELKERFARMLVDLERARQTAMGNDQLDEAVRIRDAIAFFKKNPPPDNPLSDTAGGGARPPVPDDAELFEGHHYKVFNRPMTVIEAAKACEELGGHLVRIESPNENAFVFARIQYGPERYWIDGSDSAIEGMWQFSDGTDILYRNWADKTIGAEPNNGDQDEHWIQINTEKGVWYDESAGKRAPFVCEWDY